MTSANKVMPPPMTCLSSTGEQWRLCCRHYHRLILYIIVFLLSSTAQVFAATTNSNVTDEYAVQDLQEVASVKSIPTPSMTVERAELPSPQSAIRYGAIAPFNSGKPFYLERDPLTGGVDFSKRTTDSSAVTVAERSVEAATESEYYEDEEEEPSSAVDRIDDFKDGEIDRKDTVNGEYQRPNAITDDKNPFRITADLHQFLNLPVHYSSDDKFPLISSSYANTKIQGMGTSFSNAGTHSNHKYGDEDETKSATKVTTTRRPPASYYGLNVGGNDGLKQMFPPSVASSMKLTLKTESPRETTTTTTTTLKTIKPFTTAFPMLTSSGGKNETAHTPTFNEYEELVYSDYDQPHEEYVWESSVPAMRPVHSTAKHRHPANEVNVEDSSSHLQPSVVTPTEFYSESSVTHFKPTSIPDIHVTKQHQVNTGVKENNDRRKTVTKTEDKHKVSLDTDDIRVSVVTSLPSEMYFPSTHSPGTETMTNGDTTTSGLSGARITTGSTTTNTIFEEGLPLGNVEEDIEKEKEEGKEEEEEEEEATEQEEEEEEVEVDKSHRNDQEKIENDTYNQNFNTKLSQQTKSETVFVTPTTTPLPTTKVPVTSVTTTTPKTSAPLYYQQYYGNKETYDTGFKPIADEPFRPIFGPQQHTPPSSQQQPELDDRRTSRPALNEIKSTPSVTHSKPYFEYHSPSDAKPLPNHGKIEFVERIPPVHNIRYTTHRPSLHKVQSHPGSNVVDFSRLDQSGGNPSFKIDAKINATIENHHEPVDKFGRPVHIDHLKRPGSSIPGHYGGGQSVEHLVINQNQAISNKRPPGFVRLPDDVPFHVKKHSNGSVVKLSRPEEIIYPQQKPIGVIPPSVLTRPDSIQVSPVGNNQKVVQFHTPINHENNNHYFKVPLNEENPSYSLQTSFSIGLADGDGHAPEKGLSKLKPGQGVGEVLFPNGSTDLGNKGVNDNDHGFSDPLQVGQSINGRPPPYVSSLHNNRPNHPIQVNRPPTQSSSPSLMSNQPHRPLQKLVHPESPKPLKQFDTANYPRPHWEAHGKLPLHFGSPQQSLNTAQEHLNFPAVNRVKAEQNIQRPELPNILPQFRPNAKVGSNEFPVNAGSASTTEKLREPSDTLQPPPLPQPQLLVRVNRNDDSLEDEGEQSSEVSIESLRVPSLIQNRRTGAPVQKQSTAERVTTLQMMQQNDPLKRNPVTRIKERHDNVRHNGHEQIRPLHNFAVDGSMTSKPPLTFAEAAPVTAMTTPTGSSERKKTESHSEEQDPDIDPFPLDDGKNFPIPNRDRVDTPILKTKTPAKPALKNDFPYEILKPQENVVLPEERISTGVNRPAAPPLKEYNAFSPTVSSGVLDTPIKDHDAEINLIPYLQDYMPYAIKKLVTPKTPASAVTSGYLLTNNNFNRKKPEFIKLPNSNKPISVTLNTKFDGGVKSDVSTGMNIKIQQKHHAKPLLLGHVSREGGATEIVAADRGNVFLSQVRISAYPVTAGLGNHRPPAVPAEEILSEVGSYSSDNGAPPKPLDLEAPFQASLSAPQSQGWVAVKSDSEDRVKAAESDAKSRGEHKTESKATDKATDQRETIKFDFFNFKPELIGGFKPIVTNTTSTSDRQKSVARSSLSSSASFASQR